MDAKTDHELIYDWNSKEKVAPLSPRRRVQFLDETLRDGIQSPSVTDPVIEDKLRLVDLANALGIDTMDIGLPGAGQRAVDDVTTIARHIRDGKLQIKASCAARTHARAPSPARTTTSPGPPGTRRMSGAGSSANGRSATSVREPVSVVTGPACSATNVTRAPGRRLRTS